jgi:hypothetical protein
MRALASARLCCHLHRAGPLVRPGTVPTALASQVRAGRLLAATSPGPLRGRNGAHSAHSPTGGVRRCLLAEGHGCLLGCLGQRWIADTNATAGPARGGSGAGSGPERPLVDRHQRLKRGRGSVGPDLSLARLLGGRLCAPDRQQRVAALAGVHRVGRSLVTTTPSRTGPAAQGGGSGLVKLGGRRARSSQGILGPGPLVPLYRTPDGREPASRRQVVAWQVPPGQLSATRTRARAAAGRADAGEASGPGGQGCTGPLASWSRLSRSRSRTRC